VVILVVFTPPEKVHEELFKEWHVPFHNPSYPAVKLYNQNLHFTKKYGWKYEMEGKDT
jgi:nucleolar protein 15